MKQTSRGYRGGLMLVQGGGSDVTSEDSGGVSNVTDHLEYCADMIRQLQKIARQNGCSTLAGILELAFREVDIKRRELAGDGLTY